MDIGFEYTKKRKEFGKHPNFNDVSSIEIGNIDKNDELKNEWIMRPITNLNIDCIPGISSHYINTERYIQKDTGMSHNEGGWPKDVKMEEFSDKQRYIRKLEMDTEYNTILLSLAYKCLRCIKQNNSINMYQEYFINDNIQHNPEPPTAKTISILKDLYKDGRPVSRVVWHPENENKIATLYASLKFQNMNENTPKDSYIWNINNPNKPIFIIKPTSHIISLGFNKKNPDQFICGEYNGLVQLWDIKKSNKPIESSKIEKTHKDPVYDIKWIQSRTGNEFVTVSTDGWLYWWDSRKLSTGPMDELQLKDNDGNIYGGTCLEYRPDAGATKYLIGTENGNIILVERKQIKGGGSTKLIKCIYGIYGNKHHGPIYNIERNYFIPKVILTVGDWQNKIWLEEIKTPIMSTKYNNEYLTSCCWSPTKCSIFYTSSNNGIINIYDYYDKQINSIYNIKIFETNITNININYTGKYLAASNNYGQINIIKLSKNLYKMNNNEKVILTNIFEREGLREKTLQLKLLASKKKKNDNNKTSTNNDDNKDNNNNDTNDDNNNENDIKILEQEFLKMIKENESNNNDINNNIIQNNNNDNDKENQT